MASWVLMKQKKKGPSNQNSTKKRMYGHSPTARAGIDPLHLMRTSTYFQKINMVESAYLLLPDTGPRTITPTMSSHTLNGLRAAKRPLFTGLQTQACVRKMNTISRVISLGLFPFFQGCRKECLTDNFNPNNHKTHALTESRGRLQMDSREPIREQSS